MKNKINLCVLFIGLTSSLFIQGAQRQLLHSTNPATGLIAIQEAGTGNLVAELDPRSKPLFDEDEDYTIDTYMRIAYKSNLLFCYVFCERANGDSGILRTDAHFHPLANVTEVCRVIAGYQLTGSGRGTEFTPQQIAQIQYSYFTPSGPQLPFGQPLPFFPHPPFAPVTPMQTAFFANPYPAAMPIPFMTQHQYPLPALPQQPLQPAQAVQQSIEEPTPQTVQEATTQPTGIDEQATEALRAVLHAMQTPQTPPANTVQSSTPDTTEKEVEEKLPEPDPVPSADTRPVLEPSLVQQVAATIQPTALTTDESINILPDNGQAAPCSQRTQKSTPPGTPQRTPSPVSEAEEDAAEKAQKEAARQEAEQQEAQRKAEESAKADAAAQEQAAADKARKAAAEKARQDALKAKKERRAAQAERDRQADAAARRAEQERKAEEERIAAAQKAEKTSEKKPSSAPRKSKPQPSAQKNTEPSQNKSDDGNKILEAAMAQAPAESETRVAAAAEELSNLNKRDRTAITPAVAKVVPAFEPHTTAHAPEPQAKKPQKQDPIEEAVKAGDFDRAKTLIIEMFDHRVAQRKQTGCDTHAAAGDMVCLLEEKVEKENLADYNTQIQLLIMIHSLVQHFGKELQTQQGKLVELLGHILPHKPKRNIPARHAAFLNEQRQVLDRSINRFSATLHTMMQGFRLADADSSIPSNRRHLAEQLPTLLELVKTAQDANVVKTILEKIDGGESWSFSRLLEEQIALHMLKSPQEQQQRWGTYFLLSHKLGQLEQEASRLKYSPWKRVHMLSEGVREILHMVQTRKDAQTCAAIIARRGGLFKTHFYFQLASATPEIQERWNGVLLNPLLRSINQAILGSTRYPITPTV